MKLIFGLDLGTTSVGWAVVRESEDYSERATILAAGSRTYPLTSDETQEFSKGETITTNAARRIKHAARINNHRFKLRRAELKKILIDNGFISTDTLLAEDGAGSTYTTLKSRAMAATERVSLEELARIFLLLNKKRGYKSNRKATSTDDTGENIDGIELARLLHETGMAPCEYTLLQYRNGCKCAPKFYRSDLESELHRILKTQISLNPAIDKNIAERIKNKNERQTWAIIASMLNIQGAKRSSKRDLAQKIEECEWRVKALHEALEAEQLAVVVSKINGAIASASGLLSDMSDRSKELIIHNETIGQYKMRMLSVNPNFSFRNKSFYRQDYVDEFEKIWAIQSRFHPELTPELKEQIRDRVIFYQRPLKSQKSSVAYCELTSKSIKCEKDGRQVMKTVGPKVAPKSSPMFQRFRIWQRLNDLRVNDNELTLEQRRRIADELEYSKALTGKQILKILYPKDRSAKINFDEIKGNETMTAVLSACERIVEISGRSLDGLEGITGRTRARSVGRILEDIDIDSRILEFDTNLTDKDFEMQPSYRLWHLLYSNEGDDSRSGTENLERILVETFGFNKDTVKPISAITFPSDYGSLSVRAMKRLLPFMQEGMQYSDACAAAGYNHSARSVTRAQLDSKEYVDRLENLPKNSLRNPVVEKILNQMIHVVNALAERFGRPDEIRIELARELKKSAKERADMTQGITARTKDNARIMAILNKAPFSIPQPSRNDIIRYRLYEELKDNGYKTLYTSTYISAEELFSKKFNIEHIIPQATLFDDSFANKTLETTQANIEKGNETALDYVETKFGPARAGEYSARVKALEQNGSISRAKAANLLRHRDDIPTDFINRDLRNTQYIARKAKQILEDMSPRVTATSGAITDRLREDWQLIDVMKELNWDKYHRLGMTSTRTTRDGHVIRQIDDWTKRNDNRHHAMDAITIAFTRPEYIQYLNNLAARSDKNGVIYAIQQKHLYRDTNGKLRFRAPIPLDIFRAEARKTLENILVSIKAKNRVVTLSRNRIKRSGGEYVTHSLTPRAQLHNETVYGVSHLYCVSEVPVNASMTAEIISKVSIKKYREALDQRLAQFGGDPKKAFTGKNSPKKNPIYTDPMHTDIVPEKVKITKLEPIYTYRVKVNDGLNVSKVIDKRVRAVLEERIREFDGNQKEAFANLDENPIYFNREKGITIKSVKIRGPLNVVALHSAHDHLGRAILDTAGNEIPTDYVQTSGNHHAALFLTPAGKVEEVLVSYLEATARATAVPPMPIIDRNYRRQDGWQLLMTLKRNEYLVFPRYETSVDGELVKVFDPKDIDLLDPTNYPIISPNLFRVQKITRKDYYFRHHLETNVDENKELRDITWKRITAIDRMAEAVKVRIDHIGRIIHVGEY